MSRRLLQTLQDITAGKTALKLTHALFVKLKRVIIGLTRKLTNLKRYIKVRNEFNLVVNKVSTQIQMICTCTRTSGRSILRASSSRVYTSG